MERVKTFCKEFKPIHIQVFIDVLEKLELHESVKKELRQKLYRAIDLFDAYIQDEKQGFPHGGKESGPPKDIAYLISYLYELWSQTTKVIRSIFPRLIGRWRRSYTWRKGYNKELAGMVKKYQEGMERWDLLIEPVDMMIAEPANRDVISHRWAKSRVVNTLNHFQKHANVPEAQPYTGPNQWTHRNQLPIGKFTSLSNLSLSPRRTRRSKPKSRSRTPKPQGIRI